MLVTLMKQSMNELPNFDPSAALQFFPNCKPYGLLSSTFGAAFFDLFLAWSRRERMTRCSIDGGGEEDDEGG
jgi:hypothetical protein